MHTSGRERRPVPAFDAFDLSAAENDEFGGGSTKGRHFTQFGIDHDTDTALTVSANLAAKLDALGADVNHLMYWDEGHGANNRCSRLPRMDSHRHRVSRLMT